MKRINQSSPMTITTPGRTAQSNLPPGISYPLAAIILEAQGMIGLWATLAAMEEADGAKVEIEDDDGEAG